MFDIFQNIHILYLQYGVLSFTGYGVLNLFPLWSLVSAGTDTGHPSRIFRRCSAMCHETPVMSSGFQANMSKLCLTRVMEEGYASDPETIVHLSGIILLLRSMSIPLGTGNFNIP
ncbi:hypothetical protein Tco_1321408 [Tanacetum coccineum]